MIRQIHAHRPVQECQPGSMADTLSDPGLVIFPHVCQLGTVSSSERVNGAFYTEQGRVDAKQAYPSLSMHTRTRPISDAHCQPTTPSLTAGLHSRAFLALSEKLLILPAFSELNRYE